MDGKSQQGAAKGGEDGRSRGDDDDVTPLEGNDERSPSERDPEEERRDHEKVWTHSLERGRDANRRGAKDGQE